MIKIVIFVFATFCVLVNAQIYDVAEDEFGGKFLMVPLSRQRRQTTVDINKNPGGTQVTLGHQGTIFQNDKHKFTGEGFASKQFRPSGPTTLGGGLGYQHLPSDEVDILKLMNVSAKDQGVSLVEGPIQKFPAYKFRLPYGNVALPNSTEVTVAMNNTKGFTAVFLFRQQKNNLGTLISVNSPGRLTPWFQLTTNSKTGLISLKYRLDSSTKLKQMDWILPRQQRKSPIAAWTWLSMSMDYESDLVRLDLDCLPSKFESIGFTGEISKIHIPSDALVYFRQEPGRKKKFLGSMQVAKVLPYVTNKRLWMCYEISGNPALGVQKPILLN